MSRLWKITLLLSVILLSVLPVFAHATLIEATPGYNAILDGSPGEIRLRFSEPLEPMYSRINLANASGNLIDIGETFIDPADPTVMWITPPSLPDGVYSVEWRALSAADGHPTLGSYPITIGLTTASMSVDQVVDESIPATDAVIRWANLFIHALIIGSVGFWLFVWEPSIEGTRPENSGKIERRMSVLIVLGWLALGLVGIFVLRMQVALATGLPISQAFNAVQVNQLVSQTRFGHLWMLRIAFWIAMGGALAYASRDRWYLWIVLLLGAASALTTSLFSHASGVPTDQPAAIASDWLHFTATTLWIGGLIQFFSVIGAVRRRIENPSALLATLVGHFSNFARVAVVALVITGLFATWQQVNLPENLLSTRYGTLLLIKLGLFAPLLILAAINLTLTHARLRAGVTVWTGRLRGLVTAEIALTVAILAIVGAMTSIAPARTVADTRAAIAAAQIPPNPIEQTITQTGITGTMVITPGYVGVNTFTLTLKTEDGEPVTAVTRIRLRFRSTATQGIGGDSELRMDSQGNGVYTASGANLSEIGDWRIRATVARPNEFDRLYDFTPTVAMLPPPPPLQMADPNAPLPNRVTALMVIGLLSVTMGGFFLGQNRLRVLQGSGLIALGLLLVGVICLVGSVIPLSG
ncbi:MAG: copper resistance protein CopC [Anaerolineae bacterium]